MERRLTIPLLRREPGLPLSIATRKFRDFMHRLPLYLRLFAAAFAFLVGSSAMLPAVAAVHMVVYCSDEAMEVLPAVPPCHPQEDALDDEPAEINCCPSDAAFEPVPVPRAQQEVQQTLIAVEHTPLVLDPRPTHIPVADLPEQVPLGLPDVGLPVLNASLLI